MSEQRDIVCAVCSSANVQEMITLFDRAKIMLCENCKNAFTIPKPKLLDYTSQDFQAGQGDTDRLTYLENLPEEIKTSYTKQLAMITKYIPRGSAVLEIGGGEGIFLDMVKKEGYQVDLVEPSISASHRAAKRGLNVQNDYFQNVSLNKKYSLVCMSHVLEHVDDPMNAIHRIKELLNPNGSILLAQTNFKGFMPWLLKANWYAWVPDQHFTHFSLAGLKYLAKKSSLVISTYQYSRLVHGPSIYHQTIKYIPFLQDQIHILLKMK